MPVKWETVEKQLIDDYKIFNLELVRRYHPEWKREGKFVVLDSPRWVNIIPLTKDNNVVLIKQYRHGIDEITIEIPGGLVDNDETPLEAACRECTEETGYSSDVFAELLGENIPNPAFLNNRCWSYVWRNCERTQLQNLDGNEQIDVIEVPLKKIRQMILDKEIQHSLVLTAFFYYFLKYDL